MLHSPYQGSVDHRGKGIDVPGHQRAWPHWLVPLGHKVVALGRTFAVMIPCMVLPTVSKLKSKISEVRHPGRKTKRQPVQKARWPRRFP
jgi:hypothetical protein